MKRILLPLVAYLLCILPLSFHKPPRQIQILTSGIEFRTLTFGRTYVPEGARDGVCLTDTIHYLCPATGSDPFTLAALQTLLPREVFGYGGQVTPSSFARYAEGLHNAYINEYENDAYGMRDSADAPPLYMNYSRYVTMRLDFSSPRAVVIEQRTDLYTGGAHGVYTVRRMSIRLGGAHTRVLRPSDIFVQNVDSTALLDGVKQALLAGNGCRTAEELAEKTCINLEEVFLTPNVSIDPEGVTFIYQPYEIACYAGGAPRVTLPMAQVRRWLRPGIEELFPPEEP